MGTWSSDQAHWERVCEASRRHGARLVVLRQPLDGAIAPEQWRTELPDEAQFWWRHEHDHLVGVGCTQDVKLHSGQGRFEAAQATLQAWAQSLEDPTQRDAIVVVGGFAFDERPRALSSRWHGFGSLRLWLPRLTMRQRAGVSEIIATLWVYPAQTLAAVVQDVEALELELKQWQERAQANAEGAGAPATALAMRQITPYQQDKWASLVDEAAAELGDDDGGLRKVVLARAIDVELEQHPTLPQIAALTTRLGHDFAACHVFALSPPGGHQMPWFVGASPECLVRAHDQRVYVDALAGTLPADADPEALMTSDKDRHEHALVIEAIEQALADLGELEVPAAPEVDRLANVLHLRTPITLAMRQPTHLLELARRLHPTPAVCGLPRDKAMRFIREREGMERGWYTGAVGWMDLDGGGELAVAIRCALISSRGVRLYTGAGIVAQSVSALEVAETDAKARAILDRLRPDVTRADSPEVS